MGKNISKYHLGIVVMLGAVWGLSEAALGMGLRSCASFVSGSLMTGVALFFITASWAVSRRFIGIALLIIIASLFKMFDAFLLSLPMMHGAVANPIFAFIMEGLAFLVLIAIINENIKQKITGQAILGGLAALFAVNLFPLVKYATGIPACVFPGTNYPLSLYYSPVAIFLSLITVPLGFFVGAQIETIKAKFEEKTLGRELKYLASPVTLILCLGIIVLIRLS